MKLITIITFALLLLMELVLRRFWRNPYTLIRTSPLSTRLHLPGRTVNASARGLYPDAGRIRFSVGEDYAIVGAAVRNDWALGGSTTECGLVPEGQRWPDLLQPPAFNYGVSANSLREIYYNARYLLENGKQDNLPRRVYVLQGVNDLRTVLREGFSHFNLTPQPFSQIDGLTSEGEKRVFGLRVASSSVLSWLLFALKNMLGRKCLPHYQAEYARQATLSTLDPAAFIKFEAEWMRPLETQRYKIIQALHEMLTERGIELILLTQPHGYRSPSTVRDLRVTAPLGQYKMTLEQMATTLNMINQHTRTVAQSLGIRLVDTAACLEKEPDDVVFYDGIHFTLEGSRKFAQCVVTNVL